MLGQIFVVSDGETLRNVMGAVEVLASQFMHRDLKPIEQVAILQKLIAEDPQDKKHIIRLLRTFESAARTEHWVLAALAFDVKNKLTSVL